MNEKPENKVWLLLVATILVTQIASNDRALAQEATPEEEQKAKSDVVLSGFLGDGSDLRPHPEHGKNLLVWKKEAGVLAQYSRFQIEKPLIYFHPEAWVKDQGTARGVDPEELARLSDLLHESVIEALEKGKYQVVGEADEAAAEGTLILRIAITDVEPVDPKKNLGTKTVGAALGVGLVTPRADLGRAAIEVEMIDGVTGERVAAVAAARKGRRMGGTIKGAKRWGDVRAAFDKWAKQFRKQLDEATRDQASNSGR